MTTPRPGQHVPALDGVRGLAVFLVLAFHIWPSPLTSFGWAGVDLFFVLSGFLITGILVDSRHAPGRARTFYLRRALRILPLYYGVLVVFFVVVPIVGRGHSPMYVALKREQIWYWSYLCDWRIAFGHPPFVTYLTHFWTLSIEEQFYLAWPLVIWAASTQTARRVSWAIIIGVGLLRVVMVIGMADPGAAYSLLPCRVDALAIGAVLALTLREPDGASRLAPWVARTAAVGAFTTVLVAAVVLTGGQNTQWSPLVLTVGFPAIDWACAGLVLVGALTRSPILEWGPLRLAGRYSYGIYVYHVFVTWPLAQYVFGLHPGTVAHAAFSLVGTAVLAGISFHFFESPFLRLKDRLRAQRPSLLSQPGCD